MERLKHIWKYLTSPWYRAHIDLMCSQMAIDALVNQMKEQQRLASLPPIVMETMEKYNLGDPMYATKLLKARGILIPPTN